MAERNTGGNPGAAEGAENEASSSRDSEESSEFDWNGKYAAAGLKHTLHGNIYQLKLLMLFAFRALQKGYSFSLATEMKAAEKLDDVVLRYKTAEGPFRHRFLQAKHSQDGKKRITAYDLMTEKEGAFSLQKYFISYRKMKKNLKLKGDDIDNVIICTNIDFHSDVLESETFSLKEVYDDEFFYFESSAKKPGTTNEESRKNEAHSYKFAGDKKSKLYALLKRGSDIRKLANKLVEHTVSDTKKMTLKCGIFQLYHVALGKEVIDINNQRFFVNFADGKDLSKPARNFREMFLTEVIEQWRPRRETRQSKDPPPRDSVRQMIKDEIPKLKLSAKFGKGIKLISNPRLERMEEFSTELVELINGASEKTVIIDGRTYGKNAKDTEKKVIANNIDKLAGHVLILSEDGEIKFRPQFFDDTIDLLGNLEEMKQHLKEKLEEKYDDLDQYRFKMPNTFETCTEEQLYSEAELPDDDVEDEEIDEFFEKLIFAVNQPNEIKLGKEIAENIAEFQKLDKKNAKLVCDSFQTEMLDWFKEKGQDRGKEGEFYTHEKCREFFECKCSRIFRPEPIPEGAQDNNKNDVSEDSLSRDPD